jgi:putative endonuclease
LFRRSEELLLIDLLMGNESSPQGLKPDSFWPLYAALKRRSSTLLHAFHVSARLRDSPGFPVWEGLSSPSSELLERSHPAWVLGGTVWVEDLFVPSGLVFSRRVFSGQATRLLICFLDWLAECTLPAQKIAAHYRTGRRGEEAAYFHLRKLGYVMVARNFRSPRCRGEIDLIGWEDDVLCFVEVKTRTTRDAKPGEAAVDRHKRRQIAAVAREYLRRFPPSCQWRFDVVSVYYLESKASQPQIEVFRNSSLTA